MTNVGIKADSFDINEATTLSTEIRTNLDSLLKSYTPEQITQAVLDAEQTLQETARMLRPETVYSAESRREIDISSDGINGGLYDALSSMIRAYDASLFDLAPAQLRHLQLIEQILDAVYPEGKEYLTSPRTGQFGAQEQIFSVIDQSTPLQQAIKETGLTPLFEIARQAHKEYGVRHGYTEMPQTSQKELWNESLERYVARVIGNHDRGTALREALLAPYTKAADSIRTRRIAAERRKRNKKAPNDPTPTA